MEDIISTGSFRKPIIVWFDVGKAVMEVIGEQSQYAFMNGIGEILFFK